MRVTQKKSPSLTPNKPERHFVSDADLETITGVKRRTWQKHRLFNRGPRFYKLHGAVRYDLAEVLAWIDAHAAGGETVDVDRPSLPRVRA